MKDPKIIGIGGVFFKAKSAENLQNWYQNQLGVVLNPYGATFEMRHSKNPKKGKDNHLNIFPNDTAYFKPSEKDFIINYRA